MEDNSFVLSTMQWSFSRINSFSGGCRREWKLHYIDCEEPANSFDGQTGGAAHTVLEEFFKGKITEWDMSQRFQELIESTVTYPCPYPNGDSKTPKVLEYFDNFSFDLDKYEVLGVEKQINFNLKGKYPLIGFIDLLLREKETGKIILCDHKTSTIKFNKNGSVSKSDAEHWLAFKRQQYLYSYVILQEYGRVDRLEWNMLKDGKVVGIDWSEEEMNEAIDWAYNSIVAIEKEESFPAKPDYYYCYNLCSCRENYCPYKRLGTMYSAIYSKCYNPKSQDFETFGGVGVGICDEWKDNPQIFYQWSLDNGYADDLFLKRYDYSADYSPENCYWDVKDTPEWM